MKFLGLIPSEYPVKADCRDAVQLANLMRSGDLTPVYDPQVESVVS